MTHIHYKQLAKLREAGQAPQGGGMPDDLSNSLIESKIPRDLAGKLDLVDRLFQAAAVYPDDRAILGRIGDLVGRTVGPAELHYPDTQQKIRDELSCR